ncbi:MAG TPA: 1-acyl-sn-glycerol-3-phosphate acyltransferase [Methylophaga aminisulfidivorans]|uniref:1-acyl-sn-glycerol-3-phosphate acyltransferase n=2 Tax=root TaxID=1 RepID=A0A7C2AI29_9GAMM|nr:1-acyl-sn-glycerol-3-phosphate acyltransferase [Methylophaga aminisulfidivorans]
MLWYVIAVAVSFYLICIASAKADWGGAHLNWLDGLTRLLCRFFHRHPGIKLNLPKTGPAIVAANHISGLDPLLLIAASSRPLRFLIATEEYHRPVLHWIFRAAGCIPVDRKGRPEQALRAAKKALDKGEIIALFPHGKIHLDSDPPRPIKAGVVRLALWTKAPLYAVRIDGVTAQGHVLIAPFIPSHVRLVFSPVMNSFDDKDELLQQLTGFIETPSKK